MTTNPAPKIPECDNGRRDDAELKAEILALIEEKEAALAKALALVKEAQETLFIRHAGLDDTIYCRATSSVWGAIIDIEKAIQFNFRSDTYLGNKACGPLGAAVLKDMNKAKAEAD